MKTFRRSLLLAAMFLAAGAQQAAAQGVPQVPLAKPPILLGTTGACNNILQGGPCTQTSTLVLLNANTGALIKTIGPVGFTVNGLAWDRTSETLYASTSIGDAKFHGLIKINPFTGAGKPVNPNAVNFGLAGAASPIHSIAVDVFGHMVGWYDEFPPPAGVTDTYVRIDQHTGVATEFPNTGIDTAQNGVAFGEFNVLWNIDSPRINQANILTQTAYLLNPFDGKPLLAKLLTPPTPAALGDFHPVNNLYYGLNFTAFSPTTPTFIVVVDVLQGTVTTLGQTVNGLHTLAFIP
jgi:hypothetical protein